MDGTFVVENGSIADALAILLDQPEMVPRWAKLQWWLRYFSRHARQFNPRGRARNNVAHHYDLDGRLYSLFLDADKQYSCAYFETPDTTLDDAQLAKKRHLAAKLLIGRGNRVLDIGSGWGGLGLYLAEMTGADVTGITLSIRTIAGLERPRRRKEPDAVGEVPARAIIAILPARSTASCRSACSSMSASTSTKPFSGAAPNCSATTASWCCIRSAAPTGPDVTSPWITKYIFPGGYIPALSEVMPAIEKAGLLVCDIEILRLHYAETLKAWRERFMARREEAVRLYDERFARMWEFYLAASEMSFRKQNLMNFQIQLTKRQGIVPMTRDYITAGRSAAARDGTRQAAAAAVGGRIGRPNRGGVSSAGCKPRHKAYEPTPDGRVGRAPQQATDRHRARHAVPGAKSLPSCRSASTATSAGRLPIAIPGFADPSPVLPVRYSWQLENRRPVPDFVTNPFCGEENHTRCDLLHKSPGGPSYISAMSQQTYPAPFDSDIRIDYALIAIGVGAALFAFIYLILV